MTAAASLIIDPIKCRTPMGGAVAYGYEATILGVPPVNSAQDAVRAAIAAEAR